jgi:hypothetical protein
VRCRAAMFRSTLVSGLVLLYATAVSAQAPQAESNQNTPPPTPTAEQVIYRGVVGNLLESVPLESEERVRLQRGVAVLTNPLSARTLATALGLASPPLMIVGLIWGLWSAANIQSADTASANRVSSVVLRPPNSDHAVNVLYQWFQTTADEKNAGDRAEPTQLNGLPKFAAATDLAAIVGSGLGDPAVPCDNCFKQMLDLRITPSPR